MEAFLSQPLKLAQVAGGEGEKLRRLGNTAYRRKMSSVSDFGLMTTCFRWFFFA
jgi:hypothetical protein